MNTDNIQIAKEFVKNALRWASLAFDKTATWVTRLSWWKFFCFAVAASVIGTFVEKMLFTTEQNVISTQSAKSSKRIIDGDTSINIDDTGIHIQKNNKNGKSGQIEVDNSGVHISGQDDSGKINSTAPDAGNTPVLPNSSDTEVASTSRTGSEITIGQDNIHLKLPPEIAQEISNEINAAVADAAGDEVRSYQKKSSQWFSNFVVLAIFGLFGMKLLMGGKVRAEEKMKEANAIAEKESLLRQVSEAQMQMMQAQVEPHFLFNTLASVEYLIETDPPRAAAMQRRLIAYLRAVLPQIRENAATTNLGREADMVKSYLDLLKMRMEERLEIDFIMPEGLRSASFPPMMLQSLVENAIKHGLEVKANGGTLSFRAEVAHNKLRVTVSDTGLGFGAKPSNGTGLGLKNIRERLKLIYKEKGQIIITPNQPSGVCVTIEIPYELAN